MLPPIRTLRRGAALFGLRHANCILRRVNITFLFLRDLDRIGIQRGPLTTAMVVLCMLALDKNAKLLAMYTASALVQGDKA